MEKGKAKETGRSSSLSRQMYSKETTRMRHPTNLASRNQAGSSRFRRRSKELQYRCSFEGVVVTYNAIKPYICNQHLDLMKKTPFRHIFSAIHEHPDLDVKKKGVALDSIITRYCNTGKGILLGSGQCYPINPSDIQLIFGLVEGNRVISLSNQKTYTSQFTSRLFPTETVVNVAMLKKKLLEISKKRNRLSIEDTVRALCLLLIGSFLLSTTGTLIATRYYQCFDFFDDMTTYHWSKAIGDSLMQSLDGRGNQSPKKVSGCTIFLLYWFCEHSEMMLPRHVDRFPRFCRWQLKDACTTIAGLQYDNIAINEFKHGPLERTSLEIAEFGELFEDNIIIVTESTPEEREIDTNQESTDLVVTNDVVKEIHDDDYDDIFRDIDDYVQSQQEQPSGQSINRAEFEKLELRNKELEEVIQCLKNEREEDVENLKKTISKVSSEDSKEEATIDELKTEVLKLHSQIETLTARASVSENNNIYLAKWSCRLIDEVVKLKAILHERELCVDEVNNLTALLHEREVYMQKNGEHISMLLTEKEQPVQRSSIEELSKKLNFCNERVKKLEVVQQSSIEQLSKKLNFCNERVKKLEGDSWNLSEKSSNPRSEVAFLKDVSKSRNKAQGKDTEISEKAAKIALLEANVHESENIAQFPDSGESILNVHTQAQEAVKVEMINPCKRKASGVDDDAMQKRVSKK